MFIDSHAHLFFADFGPDLADVLKRAQDAGVERIIVPGTDLETSREAVALAERFRMIYACVGFHPHEARNADGTALEEIEKLSFHERVAAIGEIGLDYHYDFSPRDVQREVFSFQIDLARRRELPVVIHTREAEEDTMKIVEEKVHKGVWMRESGRPNGVFHCFPGDEQMARTVIGWGFRISIPGPVTFAGTPKKPNTMAGVAAVIPLEHILLETDSPYLSPVPYRGKRNEPSRIPLIAGKIAELRGVTTEEVGRSTSAASRTLFGIEEGVA
jgi:TatD DNase family protein